MSGAAVLKSLRQAWLLCLLLAGVESHAGAAVDNPRCDPDSDTGALVRKFRLSNPLEAIRLGTPYLDSTASPLSRAVVAFDVAFAHGEAGQFSEAFALIERFLPQLTDTGHKPCLAHAYGAIGAVHITAEDYEDALKWTEMGLALRQELGVEERIAGSLNNIGVIYLFLGQPELAGQYFQLALDKWQQAGNAAKAALALSNLGNVDIQLGRFEAGIQRQQDALPVFEQHGEFYSIAEAKLFTAQGLLGLRQLEPAEAASLDALRVARQQQLIPLANSATLTHARVLLAKGQLANAQQLLEAQIATLSAALHPRALSDAQDLLATVYQQRGLTEQALNAFRVHHELTNKLYSRVAAVKLASSRINYLVRDKQQQIERLTLSNQLATAELGRQKYRTLIIVLVSVVLVLLAVLMLRLRSHRQEIRRQQAVNDRLAQLDKAKDSVLANTSHELRTPLNGIIGLSELILETPNAPEVPSYAQMILDSGKRLGKVVDDLLTFSQLKEDKLQVQPAPVTLAASVNVSIQLCRPLLTGKLLQVINDVPSDLPQVMADPDRLQQILDNLLINAIKYTPHGVIRIGAQVQEGMARIRISDTGVGIANKDQARIFESFEQADGTASRHYEGLGLGLAICRRLVHLHGGEIGVDSALGEGSTFWFTIPLAPA